MFGSEKITNSVPLFLVESLEKQYGESLTEKILEGYKKKRKVTLRVNTIKTSCEEVKNKLSDANIEFEEITWYKDALVILNSNENDIRKLDIYENGEIYLQSLSSMLPPLLLEPKKGENILDMAAAPGSKTTQIAALTNNESMITACEINGVRSERLKYNLEKQGVTCSYVMVADSRKLDDFFSFDKILLDAPCSGSGTIYAEDEKISKTFTEKLVSKSSETQLALLKKAIKLLKTGGEMIYSTCSILNCENEMIVEKALKGTKAEIVPIGFAEGKEISCLPVKIPGTVCVCPNELFEGFFIAKIRKK